MKNVLISGATGDQIATGNTHYYPTELTSQHESRLFVENIVGKTENISAGFFIRAKAAYNNNTLINNMAYSLSKLILFNFIIPRQSLLCLVPISRNGHLPK